MAASEDQAKPVVRNFAAIIIRFVSGAYKAGNSVRFQFLCVAALAANTVDGLVPGGLNDPCARNFGDARLAPLVHGYGEGFLRALLRQVEVAKVPDQGR